jgi:hypothetical protein
LLRPLPEHAAPPHNVRDFGLIPIDLDRARPQKIRCCMQIQKIRFHVFSSIELLLPSAPTHRALCDVRVLFTPKKKDAI